ncbi:MAG: HAD family phosphatase [Lachnospiraceae bacterium]|nr:HAD family phosphatase [Lachnospiraceae bacterium]
MIKAILFDMDGLMIDSERVTFEEYEKLLTEMGYHMTREFYCTLLGQVRNTIWSKFYHEFGDDFPIEEVWKEGTKRLDIRLLKEMPRKDGLLELLKYLKENHYKVAVATSSGRDRVDKILETAGVLSYIDAVVCGNEVKNGKPDPEIFLKAAEKVGAEPSECMVLEDSEYGLHAAARAGMKAICIPDMKYPEDAFGAEVKESLRDVIAVLERK